MTYPPQQASVTVEVPLTKGLRAIVDDADAELVMRYKWQAMRGVTGCWYASRRILVASGKQRTELMHQMLTGWPLTDHANGDGLDNRRSNLRPASRAQNTQNSRKQPGASSSRYKGVYWRAARARWMAQIYTADLTRTPPRRQRRLGTFGSEEAAARAYDAAARVFFGEFAALNFPVEGERSALA